MGRKGPSFRRAVGFQKLRNSVLSKIISACHNGEVSESGEGAFLSPAFVHELFVHLLS